MKFYTLPPPKVEWPWLLVNPKNYKILYHRKFKHAILDCGVEYFNHNPEARDYPPAFLTKWVNLARYVTKTFDDKIWVTIPDYPDDYHPGQFGDNVEKTMRNVAELYAIDNVTWLPSLQANYLNPFSFATAVEAMKPYNPMRLAIGTVCKTGKLNFIEHCCRFARNHFPNAYIHAFGVTLKSLPRIYKVINSFDSLSYSFPLKGRWTTGAHRANTALEKRQYFEAWVNRAKELSPECQVTV